MLGALPIGKLARAISSSSSEQGVNIKVLWEGVSLGRSRLD